MDSEMVISFWLVSLSQVKNEWNYLTGLCPEAGSRVKADMLCPES